MGDDSASTTHAAAQAMLDTFASVGATGFDVTLTNRSGDKERFQRDIGLADLTRTLPHMLDAAAAREHNVIVRPHGSGETFIQLDDLAADKLPRLAPAVFLALETSPGNFQAWLALKGKEDKEFARRVRKGTGADATASGATRVAGSLNFKDKYAPNFPRVAIREARAGYVTSAGELERLGLVAAPDVFAPLPEAPARSAGNRRWPSYAICLDGAPFNSEENGPDRSRADFVWCMTAITWGFGVDETVEQLMEQSTKARANGRDYAKLTARNAALAVERRRQAPRRQLTAEHGRR
jgi:RepB DNA-primase from phage plasmid